MDRLNRRHFLWTGALFIAGCQSIGGHGRLPDVAWPEVGTRPTPGGESPVAERSAARETSRSQGAGTPESPLQRSAWTRAQPRTSNINHMGGIRRITLHHEGWQPFTATSQIASAQRIETLRNSHTNRGWADIGYHYIVDRAGRVWEGRPASYQGAHVGGNNENNLGVMLLGNFEEQSPSDVQVATMRDLVQLLRRRHNVPESAIHTHRELGATACPGRNLQPRITAMRNNHQFA